MKELRFNKLWKFIREKKSKRLNHWHHIHWEGEHDGQRRKHNSDNDENINRATARDYQQPLNIDY